MTTNQRIIRQSCDFFQPLKSHSESIPDRINLKITCQIDLVWHYLAYKWCNLTNFVKMKGVLKFCQKNRQIKVRYALLSHCTKALDFWLELG